MNAPTTRPELQIIRRHRDRLGLSLEKAGKRVPITASYWKQLEDGKRELKGRRGLRTLARMAWAVEVAPGEMMEAGRPDIEAELAAVRVLEAESIERAQTETDRMLAAVPGLPERQRAELRRRLPQVIREVREGNG